MVFVFEVSKLAKYFLKEENKSDTVVNGRPCFAPVVNMLHQSIVCTVYWSLSDGGRSVQLCLQDT